MKFAANKIILIQAFLFLAAIILIYNSAGPTLRLIDRYAEVKSRLGQIQFPVRTNELKYPDEFYKAVDINKEIFRALSRIRPETKVVVKEVNVPVTFIDKDVKLLTQDVVLEGDFVDVIRCLDDIERELGFIKIASIKFEVIQIARTSTMQSHVYFQMVTPHENEK
jgi:hypothetical protein